MADTRPEWCRETMSGWDRVPLLLKIVISQFDDNLMFTDFFMPWLQYTINPSLFNYSIWKFNIQIWELFLYLFINWNKFIISCLLEVFFQSMLSSDECYIECHISMKSHCQKKWTHFNKFCWWDVKGMRPFFILYSY